MPLDIKEMGNHLYTRDYEDDWYIFAPSSSSPPLWTYVRPRGLQPPGCQASADKPHPQAWEPWELNQRLGAERRARAIFLGLEYCEKEPDHPVFAKKVLTGPREEWRRRMEAWVDDVAKWKKIEDWLELRKR